MVSLDIINIGTANDSNDGDYPRVAFTKARDNFTALNAALEALTDSTSRFPSMKTCVIGDSNSYRAFQTDSVSTFSEANSPITWLRSLSKGRIHILQEHNFSVNGRAFDTAIFENALTAAAATDTDICVVALGVNDINNDRTYADIVADIDTFVETLLPTGKLVLFMAIHPTTTGSAGPSSANRLVGYRVNAYLRELAVTTDKIYYADATASIVNQASATGAPLSGMLYDEVHFSTKGSYYAGLAMWNVLDPLVPQHEIFHLNPEDLYNASTNPSGNACVNPMLTGTGGVVDSGKGITGTAPDSWILSGQGTLGSSAVTYSLVSRSNRAGNWLQGVFSGTPGGATYQHLLSQIATATEGQRLQFSCEYEIDASAGNLEAVWLSMYDQGGAYTVGDMVPITGQPVVGSALSGTLVSPILTKLAGSTNVHCYINFQFTGGVVSTATVRVGSPTLRYL